MTVVLERDVLRRWSSRLLEATGLRSDAAAIVAEGLVQADLRGVSSHGVVRLPVYARRIRQGLVARDPDPRVEHRFGAFALIDAQHAPGHVAGMTAIDLALELAAEQGVGAVGVRRSTHFGAAAQYVMRAAERGCIGLATSNVEPDVVPYGGAQPALGTNPLAFAAPAVGGPLVVDMATSQAAMGKILLARSSGTPLPEGWAVDAEGRPTTDPHEAVAAVPLGGPKGYALALMVEVLSAAFTGAALTHDVGRMYDTWDRPQDVGHFFLALDPDRGIGGGPFGIAMAELRARIEAVPPAADAQEVVLPGAREARTAERRRREGIPLDRATFDALEELSRELGVEPE